MPIRVHQLAKEFKISTAALKKHLGDMGVEVKSHMSPVDDEIVAKIRAKFNEEVRAIKQRQHDSKSLHKKIILANKKKKETEQEKASSPKPKAIDIPKFVEKKIEKKDSRSSHKKHSKPKPKKEQPVYKESKLPPKLKGVTEPKFKDKEFTNKDDKSKDKKFKDKSKHLKAKLKSMKKKKGRKTKFVPTELEEAEIAKNIKKTLITTSKKKKYKKDDKTQTQVDAKIKIAEFTSVSELAKLMNVNASDIIQKFFMMGQMVTINQRLDKESLEMICDEFDFDVEFEEEYGKEILEEKVEEVDDSEKVGRPPIVTVMGHVDHGKTAILDRIRSTNVIAGEAGGITQHIGAYQVEYQDKQITFLDTPGHEAFAAMRARGANVTDIAIIVVAANESVKQQTVEAIDHAKAAGVTIILAINKIDLKDANIDRVISDLMQQNLMLEGYGGEILWVPCSAKTGEGINELLDTILLSAEMLELKAAEEVPGKGIVIESMKDQRMGTIVTILLQEGTLEKSDSVVCGATFGRIRKMEDERGKEIEKVSPAGVAVLYGLNSVPKAGDILNKVENEKTARSISTERKNIRREREKYQQKTNLDNLFQRIKEHSMSEIKLIVKADTDGSVEALCDSFQKLSTDEVVVNIIRKAVGGINEADVNMASASDAIIIGFHVRANNTAKKMAEDEGIEIKLYHIIYEAIEDIQSAMQGMLAPEIVEKYMGTAAVKQIFKIKGVGTIAGCAVEKGKITNTGVVRLYRDDIVIHEGKLSSLKHYANEVKEVKAGSECGIGIEKYNDLKEGDVIENFVMEEVARKL
ncbi:MAG: translation initiation factor IF-2 [Candidatus Cloacimonetes bacterium]|nr:translation initiation factor IF-2 [Candidatus Cloacimonadota bacterium]MCF7813497.1 translation initiation factor IF-2 [Candidatus Cloacimonadota bacterium]MCF7868580.1 translation initiation factor IF-2 [Candidatus Cloacimonadota bacterium]MCF7883367.1 translation initiation factor IF-2 [Candidatus Cloacimonadota bacterium]